MRSEYRRAISVTLLVVWSCLASGSESRAQGLIPTDEKEYADLPVFDPQQKAVAAVKEVDGRFKEVRETVTIPERVLPGSVDLSIFMPTPGDQGRFGSCVGWAVAHAYTGQLAISRRVQHPKELYNLFSPYYIYNQINEGRDKGGLIYTSVPGKANAVGLAFSRGCCSRTTMPIGPMSDWSDAPNRAAHDEAANFRAFDHQRIKDLKGITGSSLANAPSIHGTFG